MDKESTAKMVGCAFREAGTLVFVFAPLYQMFEPHKVLWLTLVEVLLTGIAFLAIGILVERLRS